LTEGKCKWCTSSCESVSVGCPVITFSIKNAKIDPSGTYVLASFTNAVPSTVISLGTDCSQYLSESTLQLLGENPKCVWEGFNLKVILGNNAEVYMETFSMKSGLDQYSGISSVVVDDMGYFDPISVSYRVSKFECRDNEVYVFFDASASTGPGKKPLSVYWIDLVTEVSVQGTTFNKSYTELLSNKIMVVMETEFNSFISDVEIPEIPTDGVYVSILGLSDKQEIEANEINFVKD